MAIAFRSAANATTTTCNKPTGTVSGDVLIAHLIDEGNHTITPPSGWVQIDNILVNSAIRHASFYKVAGGSEPSTYTWTITGATYTEMTIAAYSGVDNTTPVNAHNTGSENSSSTLTVPSVTTTVANCMISIGTNEWFGRNWVSVAPYNANYTLDSGISTGAGFDVGSGHRAVTTAQAYGGDSIGWGNSTNGNYHSVTVVALQPAGSGSTVSVSAAATIALKAAGNTKSGAATIALKAAGLTQSGAATIALKKTDIPVNAAATIALAGSGSTVSAAATIALKALGNTKSAAATLALKAAGVTKSAAASVALKQADLSKNAAASVALKAVNQSVSAGATIALSGGATNSVSAGAKIALKSVGNTQSAAASVALKAAGLSKSAAASFALKQANLSVSAGAKVAIKQADIAVNAGARIAVKATNSVSAGARIALDGAIVTYTPPTGVIVLLAFNAGVTLLQSTPTGAIELDSLVEGTIQ